MDKRKIQKLFFVKKEKKKIKIELFWMLHNCWALGWYLAIVHSRYPLIMPLQMSSSSTTSKTRQRRGPPRDDDSLTSYATIKKQGRPDYFVPASPFSICQIAVHPIYSVCVHFSLYKNLITPIINFLRWGLFFFFCFCFIIRNMPIK